MLPQNTLRYEPAHARSHIGQAAQLLHKLTAKTLHEDDQNIGTLHAQEGVLNILCLLGIKTLERAVQRLLALPLELLSE